MLNKQSNGKQATHVTKRPRHQSCIEIEGHPPYSTPKQERTFKALTLLLGPETAYTTRLRAEHYLARLGAAVLPLLVTTLHHYPEITSPPWPSWPPQYEHCSRLLLHLCKEGHIPLEALLEHPTITLPIGPVLWTSSIEAADIHPQAAYESLLCAALVAPWPTTRYAAAMALANLAGIHSLHESTQAALRTCQRCQETAPVRLAAAYALLRCQDSRGIDALMTLLAETMPGEVQKAAIFILATEPPMQLTKQQQQCLHTLLLTALVHTDSTMSQYAARALVGIAEPSTLSALSQLLTSPSTTAQAAALLALEEMAQSKDRRHTMQQHMLPATILPLIRSTSDQVRQQACCTLAAIGGPYATAVLGISLLNDSQTGRLEAIKGIRFLHGVLRNPTRTKVVQWLLNTLIYEQEEAQVTALDTLAFLVWQTRTQRLKTAHAAICTAILEDGTPLQLLISPYAWVRQRAIELLFMLNEQPPTLHTTLIHLLQADSDSGVRACVAYVLGEASACWAIPTLLQTLLDTDEHVAVTALHALEQLSSPADAIVVYSVQEITYVSDTTEEDGLVASARMLLRKWHNQK